MPYYSGSAQSVLALSYARPICTLVNLSLPDSAQSCAYDVAGWGVALLNATDGADPGKVFVAADLLCSQPGGCHCNHSAVSTLNLPDPQPYLILIMPISRHPTDDGMHWY